VNRNKSQLVKSLEKKMLEAEKLMESFKETIAKRFEKQEENFKNIVNKVKSFEVTQRKYKNRLIRLEDRRNTDENKDIELQHVKNFIFVI
jgi:hypothetical protein